LSLDKCELLEARFDKTAEDSLRVSYVFLIGFHAKVIGLEDHRVGYLLYLLFRLLNRQHILLFKAKICPLSIRNPCDCRGRIFCCAYIHWCRRTLIIYTLSSPTHGKSHSPSYLYKHRSQWTAFPSLTLFHSLIHPGTVCPTHLL
jgi:hypothetical protein